MSNAHAFKITWEDVKEFCDKYIIGNKEHVVDFITKATLLYPPPSEITCYDNIVRIFWRLPYLRCIYQFTGDGQVQTYVLSPADIKIIDGEFF